MVTRSYQRDYHNLNLHTDNTMVTRRYQRDYQNLNLHTDNTMVTRKKTNNDPQHTIQKTEDRRNTNPTKKECEVVTNVL